MDIGKPTHLLIFAVLTGVFFYVASVIWSAIFIVPLPQADDWCSKSVEIETGEDQREWHCVQFKDDLEELKFHHNYNMYKRNSYWVYTEIILGALVGMVVFYIIPKWRGRLKHWQGTHNIIMGGVLGILATLVIPLILGLILPAPMKWFPQELGEIREIREQAALLDLLNEVQKHQ